MVVFPNCKINLGLYVTGKRADGYHNLQTIFYPVAWRDVLEIIVSDTMEFTTSGIEITGAAEDNLCLKAYWLLKQQFADLPPVHINLHKAIPLGGGLGGGSSNAACTLVLLNKKFKLDLSEQQLLRLALQLGSDCPFFIINKPCFALGRGEELQPINVNLSRYDIVLVHPGIHVSTAAAFAKMAPRQPSRSLREIIEQPVAFWKDELVNDFEAPVFDAHPVISQLKETLYQAGAIYASMSGSGSTVFGLFEKGTYSLPAFPPGYRVFIAQSNR